MWLDTLRQALPLLDRKLRGFAAPGRRPHRGGDPLFLPSAHPPGWQPTSPPGLEGLYPCGEGAGYAGGITSAAVDGVKVAEAVLLGLHS